MTIREILPGVHHWTTIHPAIEIAVSSYLIEGASTLLDPLLPEEGLEWFEKREAPKRVLLTNRLHSRQTKHFVDAFGCEVWTNRAGLHHFGPSGEIRELDPHGFEAGAILEGGIQSHPVGSLCPDETAFTIPGPKPALAIADGVVRDGGDAGARFEPRAGHGMDMEEVFHQD